MLQWFSAQRGEARQAPRQTSIETPTGIQQKPHGNNNGGFQEINHFDIPFLTTNWQGVDTDTDAGLPYSYLSKLAVLYRLTATLAFLPQAVYICLHPLWLCMLRIVPEPVLGALQGVQI